MRFLKAIGFSKGESHAKPLMEKAGTGEFFQWLPILTYFGLHDERRVASALLVLCDKRISEVRFEGVDEAIVRRMASVLEESNLQLAGPFGQSFSVETDASGVRVTMVQRP